MLVYADMLSGLPVVHQWRHDPTAHKVVHAVMGNFIELGAAEGYEAAARSVSVVTGKR